MFTMKATIYHWNGYVQEFLQEVLWSFTLNPTLFLYSVFVAFARTYRPALNANANAEWYCYSELFMYNTLWCEQLVLEEESYASNDSFDGLKREGMIQFLYKWLLYHWNEYVQEFLQEVLWSFSVTPLSFSIRFLLRSHVRRAPLWMRMQMHNGIVIQSYSCTTRCDVMFLNIPFYKAKVMIILVFWCNCVRKNCVFVTV